MKTYAYSMAPKFTILRLPLVAKHGKSFGHQLQKYLAWSRVKNPPPRLGQKKPLDPWPRSAQLKSRTMPGNVDRWNYVNDWAKHSHRRMKSKESATNRHKERIAGWQLFESCSHTWKEHMKYSTLENKSKIKAFRAYGPETMDQTLGLGQDLVQSLGHWGKWANAVNALQPSRRLGEHSLILRAAEVQSQRLGKQLPVTALLPLQTVRAQMVGLVTSGQC